MKASDVPTYSMSHSEERGTWSAIVKTQGYYRATDRTMALALDMGKRGMIERFRDIYDGERDQAEVLRFLRRLPEIVLAVMVADCTFTLEAHEERRFIKSDQS